MIDKLLLVAISSVLLIIQADAQTGVCRRPEDKATVDMQERALHGLQTKSYGAVEEELRQYVAEHPEQCDLSLLLGQAYMFRKKDRAAEKLFRAVLERDESNRLAMLELARIEGYHARFAESNRLYELLLASDASDESASVGLVRNLMDMDETSRAKAALKAGLKAHPNSLQLQAFEDELFVQRTQGMSQDVEVGHRRQSQVQDWTYVIVDSAGDHIVENLERSTIEIKPRLFMHLTTRVRHLSSQGGILEPVDENAESLGGAIVSAVTFQATTRLDYHLNGWLTLYGGGGGVRFNDGTSRGLFRGGFILHKGSSLNFNASVVKVPVLPTQEAETFHLTAQGLRTRLDWSKPKDRINLAVSELRYADTNLRHEQELEALHWFGARRVDVGAGVDVGHLSFSQTLNHGYFSPSNYQSYMASAAVRLHHFHHFNAEYKFSSGAESIEPSPFRFVYEVTADNFVSVGKWDLNANYTFDHSTQSTGAFQTSFVSVGVKYAF